MDYPGKYSAQLYLLCPILLKAFERSNPREFHHFLVLAKAFCAEVRSQLYVALDIGYLDNSEFRRLLDQAQEVGRIMGCLRASVEKQHKL
jgi:four helix bundle protein